MQLDLTEEQALMRDSFARFLDANSSLTGVRRAAAAGIDWQLWRGLAGLGAFGMRVPDSEDGGSALGVFDALLLMEEVGRTLASGPIAETIVAARLLAAYGAYVPESLLDSVISGDAVVTIAYHDVAR